MNSDDMTMDERLHDLEAKMNSIDTKLTQVVDAILGNPLTKTGGFMKELEDLRVEVKVLKGRVARQEDFRKKIVWTVSLVGILFMAVDYVMTLYLNVR